MVDSGDVRQESAKLAYTLSLNWARSKKFELIGVQTEPEDFAQDVVLNLLSREGLNHFESERCSGGLRGYIMMCCKRYLIDLKRVRYGAKSKQYYIDDEISIPYYSVSLDAPIGNSQSIQRVQDSLMAKADFGSILMEWMGAVPDEDISSNYHMTWKDLLELSLDCEDEGLDSREFIADVIGVKPSRVASLQRKMIQTFFKD